MDDEDDEIKDPDDILLASPEYISKKRRIADALHRKVIHIIFLYSF